MPTWYSKAQVDALLAGVTGGSGSTSITDNGDGTFTASGNAITDNGDGTYTIAA